MGQKDIDVTATRLTSPVASTDSGDVLGIQFLEFPLDDILYLNYLRSGNSLLEVVEVRQTNFLCMGQLILMLFEILDRLDTLVKELLRLGRPDTGDTVKDIDRTAGGVGSNLLKLLQLSRRQEFFNLLRNLFPDAIQLLSLLPRLDLFIQVGYGRRRLNSKVRIDRAIPFFKTAS